MKVHLIGIGGVGMSGLAHILLRRGFLVSGSDIGHSEVLDELVSAGAKIFIGHSEDHVAETDVVFYTSAVQDSNPEIQAAKRHRIPHFQRADLLAEILSEGPGITVAGTHGKTTTTSMLAAIFERWAQLDSDIGVIPIIGGKVLKDFSQVAPPVSPPKTEWIVAEADESDRSFLNLPRHHSIVTNIDDDHLEAYQKDLKNLEAAFLDFINHRSFLGTCAICIDDPNIRALLPTVTSRWVSYGSQNFSPDYYFSNCVFNSSGTSFQWTDHRTNADLGRIEIQLFGEHNVLNALGAASLAKEIGVPMRAIQEGLAGLKGIGRRFQLKKIDNIRKINWYEDYAHHPTEIRTILNASLRSLNEKEPIIVFQPHRFSRSIQCLEKFTELFKAIKHLILLPIYPAGETCPEGFSEFEWRNMVLPTKAHFAKDPNSAIELIYQLRELIEPHSGNKPVFILGAGDLAKKIFSSNYLK